VEITTLFYESPPLLCYFLAKLLNELEPILFEQIFGQVASLGCIHAVNVQVLPP
jgi:hypothetical protein